jgi:hypothetical protein
MKWSNKLFISGMGLLLLVSGLAVNNKAIENLPMAILMILGSVILFGTVAWKKLIDKKAEVSDVNGYITLVLGAFLVIGAVAQILSMTLWTWVATLVTFSLILVGAYVIYLGLITRT